MSSRNSNEISLQDLALDSSDLDSHHLLVPTTAFTNPGVLAAGDDVVAELEIIARLRCPDPASIVIDDEAIPAGRLQ
jgi:hypothetical protein